MRKEFNTSNQHGIALVIGLMLVVVFTMIGITALNTTRLQEQMAGNMQSYILAFNASESALRAGEDALNQASCPVGSSPDVVIYPVESFLEDNPGEAPNVAGVTPNDLKDFFYQRTWPGSIGRAVDYEFSTATYAELAQQPRYLLENVPDPKGGSETPETHTGSGAGDVVYERFRVTARGVGGTGNEYVLTQSTYIVDCI